MIGSKISRHFFIQSEVKPRSQLQLAHTRFLALCRLHEFTTSFDWFIGLSASVGIGHSDDFGIVNDPHLKPAQSFGSFI